MKVEADWRLPCCMSPFEAMYVCAAPPVFCAGMCTAGRVQEWRSACVLTLQAVCISCSWLCAGSASCLRCLRVPPGCTGRQRTLQSH